MCVDSVKSFNAETEQAAGAQGELVNERGSVKPQRMPAHFRGLRRRRHLRQPTDKLTCGCQNSRAHSLVALNLVPAEQPLHSDMGRYFSKTKALLHHVWASPSFHTMFDGRYNFDGEKHRPIIRAPLEGDSELVISGYGRIFQKFYGFWCQLPQEA